MADDGIQACTDGINMDTITKFHHDVLEGLSGYPKRISSRYLYDDRGSDLFQQIMHLPEYYLTDCEHEVLQNCGTEITGALGAAGRIEITELGCGDGLKTQSLFDALTESSVEFSVTAIDISQQALDQFEAGLKKRYKKTEFTGICREFHSGLTEALGKLPDHVPALILFLGSNIGNFSKVEAAAFLSELSSRMRPEDFLLLGVDLKKRPEIIEKAYNDSAGITAKFNLNLLERVNREMDANFDPDRFVFQSFYDPVAGCVQSYLISLDETEVSVAGRTFRFDELEALHTEVSHKYSVKEINELARSAGLEVVQIYTDSRNYFADCLLKGV